MYDGRKTGDNRINHIGRVGVRAVFWWKMMKQTTIV
jgi:hypothetical protein